MREDTIKCGAEMVKEVKRGSSLWIKQRARTCHDFAWQGGYGVFSIGFSQMEAVRRYIEEQEQHHRKVSFQDELRALVGRLRSLITQGSAPARNPGL